MEAVYSIDNETLCLNTQNLNTFLGLRFSQQFKLEGNIFVEIGEMTETGTCNYYMNDSENKFVMGDMRGNLLKYTE